MKFNKRQSVSSDGPGLFLKLKDGESVVGVCRGEIYEFFNKWVGGRSQLTQADDPDGRSRFRLNFVVQEDGKFVAKIWEFGFAIYNQLADLNDEYPLEKTKIKITRRGQGTDTIYLILPMVKEPIPAKTMKQIESVDLNILEHKEKPQFEGAPSGANENEFDEIPF